jgi:hypothetical protein
MPTTFRPRMETEQIHSQLMQLLLQYINRVRQALQQYAHRNRPKLMIASEAAKGGSKQRSSRKKPSRHKAPMMTKLSAVSRSCACIGSPCLRQCVHGASIGGSDDDQALGHGVGVCHAELPAACAPGVRDGARGGLAVTRGRRVHHGWRRRRRR